MSKRYYSVKKLKYNTKKSIVEKANHSYEKNDIVKDLKKQRTPNKTSLERRYWLVKKPGATKTDVQSLYSSGSRHANRKIYWETTWGEERESYLAPRSREVNDYKSKNNKDITLVGTVKKIKKRT